MFPSILAPTMVAPQVDPRLDITLPMSKIEL